jgi:predicted PolB exonuclease-like 3'-5' exonuclease
MMPSVAQWKIVCIACLLLEDYVPTKLGIVGDGKTEEGFLRAFADWVDPPNKGSNPWNRGRPSLNFVTWNGRSFDMPCIMARSFLYGIPCHWWYRNKDARYRYSIDWHDDLMDYLADFGSTKVSKMDVYAKLVGFPGKFGVDGSKVDGMVKEGKVREVKQYCLTDVVQLGAIFLRSEMVRGEMTLDDYRQKADLYLQFCDSEKHGKELASLMKLVDRAKFLLPQPSVTETYEEPTTEVLSEVPTSEVLTKE